MGSREDWPRPHPVQSWSQGRTQACLPAKPAFLLEGKAHSRVLDHQGCSVVLSKVVRRDQNISQINSPWEPCVAAEILPRGPTHSTPNPSLSGSCLPCLPDLWESRVT